MKILYQEPIMVYKPLYSRVIIGIIILGVVFFVIFSCFKKWEMVGETIMATLLAIIIVCVIQDTYRIPSGRYRYHVTFENDYDSTSIYQNYNVIDQYGLIWVIEEKDA